MTLKSDLPPFLRLLAFMLAMACATSCGVGGTNSAETQASLPISETENSSGVSFSSPNSLGLVTVTGNDAVPSGATVVVDVNAATSLLRDGFRRVANFVIPSANAATCESDLPTCPDVDADEKCQYTADTEGDFSLQIPADLGDNISISYLDPTSCQEIDVVDESTVDSDTPALGQLVTGAAIDEANRFLYVVGYDTSAAQFTPTLSTINLDDSTQVLSAPVADAIATRSFSDLSLISGDSNNTYLAANLTDGTALASLADAPSGTVDGLPWTFVTSNDSASSLTFLTAETFSITSDGTPCTAIPDQTADGFTRAFFTDGTDLYYIEFAGLLSNADAAYFSGSTATAPAAFNTIRIPLTFEDTTTATAISPANINYLKFMGETLTIMSASFDNGTSQDYYFFPLSRLTQTDICSGNGVTIRIETADALSLGSHSVFTSDATPPQFGTVSAQESMVTEGETANFFTAFFPDDQTIYYVEMYAPGDCCYRREMAYDTATQSLTSILYDPTTTPVEDATTFTLSHLGTGTIKRAVSVIPETTGQFGMFFVGDHYQGSEFFDGRENSLNTGLEPETPLYSLFPHAGFYDTIGNQIIVLDLQETSDSSSSESSTSSSSGISTFVRFYQLNDL